MQIKRIDLIKESILENDFLSVLDTREDYFCQNNLLLSNLVFVLWDTLKSLNFKRIIFFGNNEKIFFLDNESKKLCFAGQNKNLVNGPLGEINILNFKDNYFENQRLLSDKTQYEIMTKSLDKLAVENIPTCFIFIDIEYLSSNKNYTYIIKSINRCLNIRNNSNKFIFTCSNSSLDLLINKLKLNQYFKNIEITSPCKIEIMNLINNFRIANEFKIDWRHIDNFIENIYQEKLFLKDIYNGLKKIDDLSKFTLQNNIDKSNDNNPLKWIEL